MKKHQSLVYYKRHVPSCDLQNDKMAFGCECPVWITGTLVTGKRVPRQSTGWADLARANDYGVALSAEHMKEQEQAGPRGLTIEYAIQSYLLSRKNEIAKSTFRMYIAVLNLFAQYGYSQGAHYMHDITPDLLQKFSDRALTTQAAGTKSLMMIKIKAFLKEAHRLDWIKAPLDQKMKKYAILTKPSSPFTDEEVSLILKGALIQSRGGRWEHNPYRDHPATFRLLMELMLCTGMRVSDAVRYQPSATVAGEFAYEYTFAPVKQKVATEKKEVTVFLSEKLKLAIDACHHLTPKFPFLSIPKPDQNARMEDAPSARVYTYMQGLGRRMGIEDCRPHRLRDTFAVRSLLAGASLDDVSRLLGHSSVKITEKYYARWTEQRGNKLARLAASRLHDIAVHG